MSLVSPIRGTPTQIRNTPILDGQILFEVSNPDGQNHVYIDVDDNRYAVGLAYWNQLENKPFESIGYGLSVINGVLTADAQSWDMILEKPFERIGTGLTVTNGVLSANIGVPSWSDIVNKPFSSIGEGLTVDSNNRLNANVRSVVLSMEGTGTASSPKYQQIAVNTNGTTVNAEIDGTKYMEYSQTLSTTVDTVYTFTSSVITNNSAVDVFTDIWGIDPTNVSISSGSCTVTFAPADSATNMRCRIYIR